MTVCIAQLLNRWSGSIYIYVRNHGVPECVFLGSSLVQTGIDASTFRAYFEHITNQPMKCYNFGMNGATISSSETIRRYLSEKYQPAIFILGIAALDLRPARSIVEDEFSLNNDFSDWLAANSQLYRLLLGVSAEVFPRSEVSDLSVINEVTEGRTTISRTIDKVGYGPLLSYTDSSPVFNSLPRDFSTSDIDPNDWVALQHMIDQSQMGVYRLLLVEMPLINPESLVNTNQIMSTVTSYARSQGIAVLTLQSSTVLPSAAFADSGNHLHIYGSQIFSAWLGSQIGKAFAADAFDKVDDPVWFPEVKEWAPPTALATLGLKDTSYQAYQAFLEQFKLVPFDVVIYLPSDERFTRNFLQTLLGFESDWRKDMTDEERHKRYELMSLLEQARYLSELPAVQMQGDQLAQWQKNLDSTLLVPLNVRYVLCRRDRANPDVEYCPKGLADSPQYKLVGTWNLDPLYETYTLYQIESARANR